MSSKLKKRLFVILAVFSLAFVSIGAATMAVNTVADENTVTDRTLGYNMKSKGKVKLRKSAASGKINARDLLSSGLGFTSYYGEYDGNMLMLPTGDDRGANHPLWDDADVQERLNSPELRTFARTSLGMGALESTPGNMLLNGASAMTNLASLAMNALFGDALFGSKDNGGISLTDIIGGSRNNTGIIGMLFSGIYMPLIIIAALITALHLIKKGFIERKFREALGDAVWSIMAVIIGVALMNNPDLLATAPYKATNTIATCVVGAMNGENCFSEKPVSKPEAFVSNECASNVEGVEGLVDSMTCTIWKAFVMEPWAQAQFGIPYNELYTANAPSNGSIWTGLPEDIDGESFCVLNGTSKPESYKSGDVVTLDQGDKICNVAYYQAYLQTKAHSEGKKAPTFDDLDDRWYDIIIPMAKSEANWNQWTGQGFAGHRFGIALASFISAILGSSLLFILGIQGAAYKIAGTLLMAFAPMFFLFAMVPNKGVKIFLGWLETVIASILKYLAVALLSIIALSLYSGILQNTSGMTAFIAVLILSGALFAYRKEIINLVGATGMGGAKLTNKLTGGKGGLGKAALGGALGGALYNYRNPKSKGEPTIEFDEDGKAVLKPAEKQSKLRSAFSGMGEGVKDATMRDLKRGTSTSSRMWQQYDRSKKDDERARKEALGELEKAQREAEKNRELDLESEPEVKDVEVDIDGVEDNEVELDRNGLSDLFLDERTDETKALTDEQLKEELGKRMRGEEGDLEIPTSALRGEYNSRLGGDLERDYELEDHFIRTDIAQMNESELSNQIEAEREKYIATGGENEDIIKIASEELGSRMGLSGDSLEAFVDNSLPVLDDTSNVSSDKELEVNIDKHNDESLAHNLNEKADSEDNNESPSQRTEDAIDKFMKDLEDED